MTKRVRASLILIVAVATMGLASCDHYNCASGPNFGRHLHVDGSGLGQHGH